MREQIQRPFGLGADLGLSVSGPGPSAPQAEDTGWRTSGRDLPKSALPRLGQILLALIVVAAMTVALHLFFY